MDTDNLSDAAYECILKAHRISELLGVELAAGCRGCLDEADFLTGAIEVIREIAEEPQENLQDYGLDGTMTATEFLRNLRALEHKSPGTKIFETHCEPTPAAVQIKDMGTLRPS